MKKTRSSWTATALGSLTAAAALLVGMAGAEAQAPVAGPPLVGAGSFPQSFIVPGTNTSLAIGGVIQFDVEYSSSDFGLGGASQAEFTYLSAYSVGTHGAGISVPLTTDHGVTEFNPFFSRLHVETRTPTEYGELKTYFEMDGYGAESQGGANTANTTYSFLGAGYNQVSTPRILQAYAVLGPWLFGITFSTTLDFTAWADTMDGPVEAGSYQSIANGFIPQIRYTYLLPSGWSVAAALEEAPTGGIIGAPDAGIGGASAITLNDWDLPGYAIKLPSLVISPRVDQPWGHAKFYAVVQQQRLKNNGINFTPAATILPTAFANSAFPTGANESLWGYQLGLDGHLNTIGKDKFTWMLGYGQGASSYTQSLDELGTQWWEGIVCNANSLTAGTQMQCSQPRNMGVNVGYVHYWNDEWRSAIGLGYDQEGKPNTAATWGTGTLPFPGVTGLAELEHRHESEAINTHWQPLPFIQFGLEYDHYLRQVYSGAHGAADVIHGQALFTF